MLENARPLRYNKYIKRKHPLQKWMLSRKGLNVLTNTAYPVCRRGRHFLFSLISLIEKGKQRNDEASEGNQ